MTRPDESGSGSGCGLSKAPFTLMKVLLAGSGMAFVWLGLMKVGNFTAFTGAVRAHGLLHDSSVSVLAAVLVSLEILAGALAIWAAMGTPRRCAVGSMAVTLLMLGFAGYAATLSVSPPPAPAPCGCTGTAAVIESWVPIMTRNAWLTSAGACLTLGFLRAGHRGPEPRAGQGVPDPAWSSPPGAS